jgi:hypothetical protein
MKRYYVRTENGKLGSLDGPAVRTSSGLRQWLVDGRLHRSDGPAVETASGTKMWYWRGVRVPSHVIESPRARSPLEILKEPNAEIRRASLEAYGLQEALTELLASKKAVIVHEQPGLRRLIRITEIKDTDGEHPTYVEVRCPSTGRMYHLRVPPSVRTCMEAVAWTFRETAQTYNPKVET